MTLDALSRTVEFRALTVQQQLWVQTYCRSLIDLGVPDAILATRVAYESESEENVRTFSYQFLRNKKIQAALRVFRNFGKSKRAILLDDLEKEIRTTEPGSPARAKLLTAQTQLLRPKKKLRRRK